MALAVGGGEGGHVDGVAERQVHRGVGHVSQHRLSILDGSPLAVVIPDEEQLVLLAGPKAPHTLTVHLQRKEVKVERSK